MKNHEEMDEAQRLEIIRRLEAILGELDRLGADVAAIKIDEAINHLRNASEIN